MGKLLFGFLVAPSIGASVAALIVMCTLGDSDAACGIAVMTALGGYFAALVFGAPLFIIWHRKGWLNFGPVCALGGTVAVLTTFVVRLLLGQSRYGTPWLVGLANLLIFTLPIGVVAGAALWWFGVRNNVALIRNSNGSQAP